jgi:hypothetical protein
MPVRHRFLKPAEAGFSLVEVLLAASLGGLISVVAADAMISHLRTNERLEATERLRADWSRTSHFIESEVALSERVLTDPTSLALDQCGSSIPADDFRFALEIRRDLPPAIYYVQANASDEAGQWLGESSLWRCGPTISDDGNYSGQITAESYTISNARLVDGLSSSCSPDVDPYGLKVVSTAGASKSLSFNLCIKGLASKGFSQSTSTYSRISPVFSYPIATSLCSTQSLSIEGFYKLSGGTVNAETLEVPQGAVPSNQDVLICGYGGGDTINGSSANDVLEGGDAGGATISGLAGNDRLRGTMVNDLLNGGDGDDVLVGREGNDVLNGGPGENHFLPGLGSDQIQGGAGLDVVFLEQPRTSVGDLADCTRSGCSITYSESGTSHSVTMSGVEVLIFRDGRYDLR